MNPEDGSSNGGFRGRGRGRARDIPLRGRGHAPTPSAERQSNIPTGDDDEDWPLPEFCGYASRGRGYRARNRIPEGLDLSNPDIFTKCRPCPMCEGGRFMDPNADTQWNDVLREKGILPQKQEKKDTFTEDDIVNILENTIEEKNKSGKALDTMTVDELDELLEDDEDERVILEYREKRMREMKEASKLARYGDIREISAIDYVDEVNKAGTGVWVVLHLYKQGIPLCTLLNQFFVQLAAKFPATKFLRSVSSTCIPNYPDHHLPTVFIYYEGEMIKQFAGPHEFGGMKITQDVLEWMLAEVGAVKSDLEKDPRRKVEDVLMKSLKSTRRENDSDDDDDY